MPGIVKSKKMQLGLEATKGTAVAATIMWRGQSKWKDERILKVVNEEIGQVLGKARMYEASRIATITFEPIEATFEHLPYILSAGIEDIVAGAADGTGSSKIYEYNFPVASTMNAIKSYTIECGDSNRADEFEYCFVQSFKLTAAPRDGIKVSAVWLGRQATDAEFTSLTPATVEEMVFQKSKLYLDATGGTIGTTQKTATVRGWEISVDTGLEGLFTADGQLYYAGMNNVGHKITGTFTVLHDAIGEAEINFARARTVRLLKILVEGSAVATPGTTYTYKTFAFTTAIQYDGVPDLADQDGNVTVPLKWHSVDSDSIIPTMIVVREGTPLT